MPPRITRLKWPRLFPPHEPLPFLYPRWYSIAVAAAEAARSSTLKDSITPDGQDASAQAQKEPRNALPKSSSPSPVTPQDADDNTRRVPRSLVRKVQVRKLQETKRAELREKSFYAKDWRTPLMLLRKHTPQGEHHHVKQLARLDMPQGMRGFYPGNLFDLFLDIYLHTGCHVQISRGDNHKHGKFHALELSGTAATIRLARHILNEAVQVESDEDLNDRGTMGKYTTTTTPVVQDKVMPRSVWSMPYATAKDLNHVREPNKWSFQVFAAYVAELVIATPPTLQQKGPADSPANKPHVELVTERLMALYTNPSSARWASMQATVQTLQYLIEHRKIPEVRRILELIESQSKTTPYLRFVLANPSVFNVLLQSASQALDLHTYNFLLRMMTDRSVVPDVETWTSLLQLVQKVSPRNAKHIITTMRQRQMLSSPVAKMGTANATSQKDVMEWLGRGESIFDFIAHYDNLWNGKEWLDTRACNQILLVLIQTGNLQDVMAVIKELDKRNKKPNLVTTHILLDAASSYRDLKFAIEALETTLGESVNLQPDSRTFEKLAYLAFRARAYNTLRVVWRYACLSGEVSRVLRQKMLKTLYTSSRGESETVQTPNVHTLSAGVGVDNKISRYQRFKMFAAIVAIGIDKGMTEVAVPAPSAPKQAGGIVQSLKLDDASSSTDLNKNTTHDLHSTLAADLVAHKSYLAVYPFLSALRKAIEKDLRWKQEGYDKSATLGFLLAKAYSLRVQKTPQLLAKENTEREKQERVRVRRHRRQLDQQKRQRILVALRKAVEVQKARVEAAKKRIEARKQRSLARRKQLDKLDWQKKNELMVKEAHAQAGAMAEARTAAEKQQQEARETLKQQRKARTEELANAKLKALELQKERRALWAKKKLEMKERRREHKAREERKERARVELMARKEQEARQEREAGEEWRKLHQEMQDLVAKK